MSRCGCRLCGSHIPKHHKRLVSSIIILPCIGIYIILYSCMNLETAIFQYLCVLWYVFNSHLPQLKKKEEDEQKSAPNSASSSVRKFKMVAAEHAKENAILKEVQIVTYIVPKCTNFKKTYKLLRSVPMAIKTLYRSLSSPISFQLTVSLRTDLAESRRSNAELTKKVEGLNSFIKRVGGSTDYMLKGSTSFFRYEEEFLEPNVR